MIYASIIACIGCLFVGALLYEYLFERPSIRRYQKMLDEYDEALAASTAFIARQAREYLKIIAEMRRKP